MPPFSVLTLNAWIGDRRRGFCSQDAERRSWIARQLREADPDVMCLQEVLEGSVQAWFEETFSDYEFVAQHMPRSSIACVVAWHLTTGLPGLFLGLALASVCGSPTLLGSVGGGALAEWAAEWGEPIAAVCGVSARFLMAHALSSPAWKPTMGWAQIGGFPLHGSYEYARSTNASLLIGVRRSWGKVVGVEEEWLTEKGHWWNHTKAGQEREQMHFNPDRWINELRHRGILAVDVATHGQGRLRFVNMHLNIGVTNPIVRQAQLEQVVTFLANFHKESGQPQILCGDTNACATFPEPEMAWLLNQTVCPLEDCWLAAGTEAPDSRPGWTWDRANPLTVGGPLLEPDQRLDVILHTGALRLRTAACRVIRYPNARLISDHYAVKATLVAPTQQQSQRFSKAASGGRSRSRRQSPSPSPSR